MIETDIHVCASGEVVIMHDDDVTETSNGTGLITQMTLPEVRTLDAGAWFSPAYAGQKVPTLAELIGFYLDHPELELLLEFKGDWTIEHCEQVVADLNGAGLRARTVLESFSPITMAALQEVAADYQRGLLLGELPAGGLQETISLAQELNVMCLNPDVTLIQADPTLVAQCHQNELQVMVWTADLTADFDMLLELEVDAICTNRPEFLAGYLAGRSTGSTPHP
jgi:glycerophosphoryl diester phosphodiesterase